MSAMGDDDLVNVNRSVIVPMFIIARPRPDPTVCLKKAYKGGGGGPPTATPRQSINENE